MSKVLITGVSGFIGRKLAVRLAKDNQIIGFCRSPSGIKGIREINDDICRIHLYKKQLEGVKEVYHLAALINFSASMQKESIRVNLTGTKKLLGVCKDLDIRTFLFVSTGATLGFSKANTFVTENSDYIPPESNSYAYSKYLAEKEVLKYAANFRVVILNPSTVYGDGDIKGNSSVLLNLIRKNYLHIFFPGCCSFIDIDDLVQGILLAAKEGKNKNRYILSADALSYKDLINRIAKVYGANPVKIILPGFTHYPAIYTMRIFETLFPKMKFLNSSILDGFYRYRRLSGQKAKTHFKFRPKYTIEDSVAKVDKEWKKQNR